jgi:multisubunit Na+/H+ antiporter MnhB subunit
MRSLILITISRAILPVTTLFAVYLLLRGHNHPGGGFIAGLVTGSALVLQALAFGAETTRRRLEGLLGPAVWAGLAVAVFAGMLAFSYGSPFLTHAHFYLHIPGREPVHLSTTLLFDIGVYMVVVGVAGTLVGVFAEENE